MLSYQTRGICRPVIPVLVAKAIKLHTSKNDAPHKAQFTGSLQDFSTPVISSTRSRDAASRGHYSTSFLPVTYSGLSLPAASLYSTSSPQPVRGFCYMSSLTPTCCCFVQVMKKNTRNIYFFLFRQHKTPKNSRAKQNELCLFAGMESLSVKMKGSYCSLLIVVS